jgi:hypothetical protein
MELTILAVWLALAVLSAWVAGQKHRSEGEGFVLGALFGPLGVLVEALLPAGTPPSPPQPPTEAELEAQRRLENWVLIACLLLFVGGVAAVFVLELLGIK